MQGFNMGRYHAPESLDSALSGDARSSRLDAKPKSTGPPVVRFEMPFPIWCQTCPETSTSAIIGQGVRFNAQKKKVGNYYSSPIWSFRMKHTACGGWIEIRTNPAKHDFDVTEGARKRDFGDDSVVAERIGGIIVGLDAAQQEEKDRQDAFQAFEGKAADKIKAKSEVKRIEELKSRQERDWRDPDSANKRLRDSFRVGRKSRQKEDGIRVALQDRFGLGIDIVDETEEDRRRAAVQDYGVAEKHDSIGYGSALFKSTDLAAGTKRSKADQLRSRLEQGTRANMDLFGETRGTKELSSVPYGIKRKRYTPSTQDPGGSVAATHVLPSIDASTMEPTVAPSLVDYDSD